VQHKDLKQAWIDKGQNPSTMGNYIKSLQEEVDHEGNPFLMKEEKGRKSFYLVNPRIDLNRWKN
jgi:hypothetical protein